ncbi:MAG: hypothetical protein K0S71_483 [Clostridia bacterium]|jgi:hypothetical protein|nr:hypothetical protein [Clostridia bacterium]
MKRKYDTRYIKYFTNDIIVIGIFILAVISGCIYALYIKDRDSSVFLVLNSYMALNIKQSFEMQKFISGIYDYFKQLLVIWLFGFFYFTLPVSMVVLFIIIFSYAFTTTCAILIYGVKGLVIAFIAYGIQAIIMIAIGMYLVIAGLRQKNIKIVSILSDHSIGIIPVIMGSFLVSLLDVLAAANLHYMTSLIL